MSELDNVPHPICPLNLYFEGDEDMCDTSKCDFEDRTCNNGCRIDDGYDNYWDWVGDELSD